ncbi:MAG: helix-turn-helix domain-containing protein [Desulfitobacteriaceae bacterium]
MNEKVNLIGEIIPARIKEARVSRALSLSELAGKIGVTSQAISQYELGITKPSTSVLEKMSQELHFPMLFFTKKVLGQFSSNSAVNFRSSKTALKKHKEAWTCRISWLHEINMYLKEYVNFPDIDLPLLGHFDPERGIDEDTIEEVALALRKHWEVEKIPIPNLIELLQCKGFIISQIEFGEEKIEAFSQWYNNFPYIILGSDKDAAVRLRFSVAHELGHLVLHNSIDPELMAKKHVFERVEKEAHYFAGAFLLPRDSFPQEVMYKSLDHFILLKKRWKVSAQAMIKRCESLGIFNESQVRYLYAQLSQRGYRRKEPLDDVLPIETPYSFKQAIKLLIDNNVVSAQKIKDDIAYTKEEIDSMCFLPVDLLDTKPTRPQLTLVQRLGRINRGKVD